MGVTVLSLYTFVALKGGMYGYATASLGGASTLVAGGLSYIMVNIILGMFDEVVLAFKICYAMDKDLNTKAKHGPAFFHTKV